MTREFSGNRTWTQRVPPPIRHNRTKHDCKYQRHPATEAERINILADIETVKEALAKQEQGEPVGEMQLSAIA